MDETVLRKTAPDSEFSASFLQGMVDRMGISYYKYGKLSKAFPNHVNALGSMEERIKEYRRTKNTEFLMDAANFAMIEFMHPSIEGAFYKPTDSDEAPARIHATGKRITDVTNEEAALI